MTNLPQIRDLLRPGLRQETSHFCEMFWPVETDMEVRHAPIEGIALKSYRKDGISIETLMSAKEIEAALRADKANRNGSPELVGLFKKHLAIILPVYQFPDEIVVGYDC